MFEIYLKSTVIKSCNCYLLLSELQLYIWYIKSLYTRNIDVEKFKKIP